MCIPLWQFFIAVRDFKRSIREVQSNLADIKSILNGTLTMSHELEEVTAEFRNIAEFYSQESKNALRDQLCATMSAQAHEALYHRDFFKHFKLTFEFEVTRLIEEHDKRTAQLAILDIIQHMKRVVKEWINTFEYDKLKTRLLIELTLYLQESFSQYICDGEDVWPNLAKRRRNSHIKTFCEKQNIIQSLECLLAEHFNSKLNDFDCFSNNYSKGHDIIYRQRASRIRRFRRFLTSKIKIKKIGNYYREEISIQVSVDLKRASKETWELESVLKQHCSELVTGLKKLPRHRFVDVLAEENVANLGHKIADLTLKSFLPKTMDLCEDKLQTVNIKVKSLLPLKQQKEFADDDDKKQCHSTEETAILKSDDVIYHMSEPCTLNDDLTNQEPLDKSDLSWDGTCDIPMSRDVVTIDNNINKGNSEEYEILMAMLDNIPDVMCGNEKSTNKQDIAIETINKDGSTKTPCKIDSKQSTIIKSDKLTPKRSPLKERFTDITDKALKRYQLKLATSDVNKNNSGDYDDLLQSPVDEFKHLLKDELFHTLKDVDFKRLFSKETLAYAVQRHRQISKLNKSGGGGGDEFGHLSTIKDEIIQTSTSILNHSTNKRMLIDPQLIYDDLEHVLGNLLKMIGRKSARYTIDFIDRSHVMSSKVIDFLGNVHALYQYDLTEDKFCKNIFLNKIIEIIAIDLKEEEINVLKNIIFAFTNNRENKLAFLKKLEEKLPATLLKKLEKGEQN